MSFLENDTLSFLENDTFSFWENDAVSEIGTVLEINPRL